MILIKILVVRENKVIIKYYEPIVQALHNWTLDINRQSHFFGQNELDIIAQF